MQNNTPQRYLIIHLHKIVNLTCKIEHSQYKKAFFTIRYRISTNHLEYLHHRKGNRNEPLREHLWQLRRSILPLLYNNTRDIANLTTCTTSTCTGDKVVFSRL